MLEQLADIFDRLRRAEEHFESIKSELLAYYNSDPCALSGTYKPDANGLAGGGEWSAKLDPLGVRLNTLIGEFLHDLRSSLDHLVWQLVLHNGAQPTEETKFPILKVGPTSDKKGQQPPPHIAGGVSPEALALIELAQPYQLGTAYADNVLWVLHQLWNIDKHRHVIARGGNLKGHFRGRGIPELERRATRRRTPHNQPTNTKNRLTNPNPARNPPVPVPASRPLPTNRIPLRRSLL
jgi:hypothetical protein